MATIHKEILINADAETVWDAARDFGALHTRLVPGFVADTQLKPDADPPVRVVTFASGMVLDEVLVASDDVQRRLVWTIQGEQVRVSAPSRDELQAVIAFLRTQDVGVELHFGNYR